MTSSIVTALTRKPSNEEYRKNFDQVASRYERITNRYAVQRREQVLREWVEGDCLEVGAGTGKFSSKITEGRRVVATDISGEMAKEIQGRYRLCASVCDAEELPFETASFHTVIASECIYYLDHPERFVAEAYRVLKPQGRLLISSATEVSRLYESLRSLLRAVGLRGMYFDDKNRCFFNEKKLRGLLEEGGFQITEVRKIVLVPVGSLDWMNRFLEKTPFQLLSCFLLIRSERLS